MAPDSAPQVRRALALPNDDVPTLAVLGAIGPHKGARRLERMVELVRGGGMRVRFVVIGYLDVQHDPWQSDDALLTVHGPYDSRELGRHSTHRVGLVVILRGAGDHNRCPGLGGRPASRRSAD
jgi:hypothetical protein